jgi:hypothetical protein
MISQPVRPWIRGTEIFSKATLVFGAQRTKFSTNLYNREALNGFRFSGQGP